MHAQIAGSACGEPAQQCRVMRLCFVDAPFANRRRELGLELEHLINEPEIPGIVQQSLVGRDLGIDAYPESHVRFELGRARERAGGIGGRGRRNRRVAVGRVSRRAGKRRYEQTQRRQLE